MMSAETRGISKPHEGWKGSVTTMIFFPLSRKEACPKYWISIKSQFNTTGFYLTSFLFYAIFLLVKKEVLIAIIIGFGLGLIITFGIWTANKSLKNSAAEAPPVEQTETPTPEPKLEKVPLVILSPEENLLTNEESLTVNGSAGAKAIIVLIYPEGEKIIEADERGSFSTKIGLTAGVNEIKIKAYDQEGNEAEKTLKIVYSTAEI